VEIFLIANCLFWLIVVITIHNKVEPRGFWRSLIEDCKAFGRKRNEHIPEESSENR